MAEATALPIRTTVEDVISLTSYLATKPMEAYPTDAKAVLDEGVLDGRKVSAYKFWGLIEEVEGRYKLSKRGRTAGKNKGANIAQAMLEVVKNTPAYAAIVERAIHRDETSFTAVEVATHWHEHFRNVASSSERLLNDQAVCFFQIAQGAGLGSLILGRKGAPTRFEFSEEGKNKFADIAPMPAAADTVFEGDDEEETDDGAAVFTPPPANPAAATFNNKVFITHGRNIKVLNQIKEIVSYGNYQPIIAQEHETIAKPVPDKVMDDMRACSAAVIHVSIEGTYKDASGKERPKINDNVLIEIGAAMALYKRNFILVVEDGVGLELPSNLQGLYQCRYSGDELGMEATMKLLKAFKEFRE
jgi:predicted nucleotide-binding protein with TIR-like domain